MLALSAFSQGGGSEGFDMLLVTGVLLGVTSLEGPAAEVTICRSQPIHRMQQVEHLGDRMGAQIEMLAHQRDDPVVGDLVGIEGID